MPAPQAAPEALRPLPIAPIRDGTCGPVAVRNVRAGYLTGEAEGYASWPQGKLHLVGARLHVVYNAGSRHGGGSLAVHERCSDDGGRTFSGRRTICAEAGWHHGVTAWAAGADEAGTRSVIVRLRGSSYRPFHPVNQPGGTEHRLLTSEGAGRGWTARTIAFPHADRYDGDGPVMYHGYRRRPGGFETFWHMPRSSGLGVLTATDGALTHAILPIDGRPSQLCEMTAIDFPDGSSGGFLRSETAGGAMFWSRASASTVPVLRRVAGVDAVKSPVPLVRHGSACLAVSCDRRGDAVLKLHACAAATAAAPCWSTLDLLVLPSVRRGASGTGVPDMLVVGDRLLVAFGYQPRDSTGSSVCLLSCDLAIAP